jgi:hypothetical protein
MDLKGLPLVPEFRTERSQSVSRRGAPKISRPLLLWWNKGFKGGGSLPSVLRLTSHIFHVTLYFL